MKKLLSPYIKCLVSAIKYKGTISHLKYFLNETFRLLTFVLNEITFHVMYFQFLKDFLVLIMSHFSFLIQFLCNYFRYIMRILHYYIIHFLLKDKMFEQCIV